MPGIENLTEQAGRWGVSYPEAVVPSFRFEFHQHPVTLQKSLTSSAFPWLVSATVVQSALPNCRLFRIRLCFVDDQVCFLQAVVISSLSVAVVIMVGRGGSWKGSSSLESK